MKIIYIISEDNHGYLAITLSYETAIDFLIKERWLSKKDEVFFKRMNVEEFNEYMENTDDDGTLKIIKIYENKYGIFQLR